MTNTDELNIYILKTANHLDSIECSLFLSASLLPFINILAHIYLM